MVLEYITTYRLRSDDLETYLRGQFPNHQNFNVKVREAADARLALAS